MTTDPKPEELKALADNLWASTFPDVNDLQQAAHHLRAYAEQIDEVTSERKYSESLAADICKMEDALGFKNDCHDKNGAFIPTIGPWLERVRDLIAAEGELGDMHDQLAQRDETLSTSCGKDLLAQHESWRKALEEIEENKHSMPVAHLRNIARQALNRTNPTP